MWLAKRNHTWQMETIFKNITNKNIFPLYLIRKFESSTLYTKNIERKA